MQWRNVYQNVVIANYGGSKQVDNDDGSLFWRTHENFMAYGEWPPYSMRLKPTRHSQSPYTSNPIALFLPPSL
jgi:hypothetical protein